MDQPRDRLEAFWNNILEWLPRFFGALIILVITYFVARALDKAVEVLLHRVRFAERLHSGRGGEFLARILPRPEYAVGRAVFWIVLVWGAAIAAGTLGIPALNELIRDIYSYLPNVLSAIIIFLVAGAISAAIDAVILRLLGDTTTGKVAAAVAPVIVMGIAVFAILEQLRIAPQIVTITYSGLVWSIFLALALAFGLGGRDVAAQILQRAYDASIHPEAQYKKDLAAARARAERDAKKAKEEAKKRAA